MIRVGFFSKFTATQAFCPSRPAHFCGASSAESKKAKGGLNIQLLRENGPPFLRRSTRITTSAAPVKIAVGIGVIRYAGLGSATAGRLMRRTGTAHLREEVLAISALGIAVSAMVQKRVVRLNRCGGPLSAGRLVVITASNLPMP